MRLKKESACYSSGRVCTIHRLKDRPISTLKKTASCWAKNFHSNWQMNALQSWMRKAKEMFLTLMRRMCSGLKWNGSSAKNSVKRNENIYVSIAEPCNVLHGFTRLSNTIAG